ncbi:MAG TPA: hypothetical protein VNW04_07195 [Puia sp.]|nr:hypothetical protein [Puia sp.]
MLNKLYKGGKWTTAAWLTVVLPIMGIEWILFKCCYPFADFFTDSYTYIDAAMDRDAISYRPIGYSLFLRVVHALSASDTLVVTLQYLLLQGAGLGLVLTLRRWCGLREGVVAVLMLFLLADPLIPYLCNYISSDALFVGLSLIWLTVLMGLWRSPAWWRLGLQAVLLFLIFNMRYVALFYPAVAVLTVLLAASGGKFASARRKWVFSLAGVVGSVGVVVAGTLLIKAETKRETGADLFSAFSGWQIANNALNLYTHIPVDTAGLPSAECRELAWFVQNYFRGGPRVMADTEDVLVGAAETRQAATVTTAYMWLRSSPLHLYLRAYQRRYRLSYFDAWNRVGVVFSEYGYYVTRKHPGAFLRYYGWPSAKTFFWTDLDVFGVYNEGKPDVDPLAVKWFRYPGVRTRVWSATIQGKLLGPLPMLYFLLNIAFVGAALLFLPFRVLRERDLVFTGSFRLASAFLLANAFFSIFASPSVFRYQALPMTVLFVFAVCAVAKSRLFSVNWVKSVNDARP